MVAAARFVRYSNCLQPFASRLPRPAFCYLRRDERKTKEQTTFSVARVESSRSNVVFLFRFVFFSHFSTFTSLFFTFLSPFRVNFVFYRQLTGRIRHDEWYVTSNCSNISCVLRGRPRKYSVITCSQIFVSLSCSLVSLVRELQPRVGPSIIRQCSYIRVVTCRYSVV